MRIRTLRFPAFARRLKKASKTWAKSSTAQSIQPPPRFYREEPTKLLTSLIYFFPLLLLLPNHDSYISLGLFLPALAYLTITKLGDLGTDHRFEESFYYLPLKVRDIDKNLRANQLLTLLFRLGLAFLYGFCANGNSWHRAENGCASALILIAFIGLFSFLEKYRLRAVSFLFHLLSIVLALTHANTETGRPEFVETVTTLPWVHAFERWETLAILFFSGFTLLLFTHRTWSSVAPFDRAIFSYLDSEMPLSELFEDGSHPSGHGATPGGFLEKGLWKILSPKERVLFRASSSFSRTALKNWFKTTLLLVPALALPYLIEQRWEGSFHLAVVSSGILLLFFGSLPVYFAAFSFTGATSISPNSEAPSFAILVSSPKTLFSLLLKQAILIVPFLAATVAAFVVGYSWAIGNIEKTSPAHLFEIWLNCSFMIAALYLVCFFNSLAEAWRGRKGTGRLHRFLIDALLLAAIFLLMITVAYRFHTLHQEAEWGLPLTGSLLLVLFALYPSVISYVKNPRHDLIKQSR